MLHAPAFDLDTNDRGHRIDCDCETCLPEGCDDAPAPAPGAPENDNAAPLTCAHCHQRPARVAHYIDAAGRPAVLRTTSCDDCQRRAFAGL